MSEESPFSTGPIERRQFLKHSILGASACLTLPTFLENTIFSLDARAQSLAFSGQDGPILVIVQLSGGNDSLNTVIPYRNNIYLTERPTLRLTEEHGVFPLGKDPTTSDELALHPHLTHLRDLWESGELAIVNGVGYPNPNLSHFTSFDFWHSGRPNEPVRDGWLGRFFDHQCSGCDPTAAINFARGSNLAFSSNGTGANASISIADPESYFWFDLNTTDREVDLEELYRRLTGVDHPVDPGLSNTDDVLAYVQRSTHNALISSQTVLAALANATTGGTGFPHVEFPDTRLGRNFSDTAALISGGLNSRIFYVSQGGYDTHNNQITEGSGPLEGRHADLLTDLNDALGAFVAEIKALGIWERVLIFTFSEFGRKVIENGSSGTDHGAAETLFVTGGAVKPGFYGSLPSLARAARIKKDSLQHNVDFRSIYRTVLQSWMEVPANVIPEILPSGDFPVLSFV